MTAAHSGYSNNYILVREESVAIANCFGRKAMQVVKGEKPLNTWVSSRKTVHQYNSKMPFKQVLLEKLLLIATAQRLTDGCAVSCCRLIIVEGEGDQQ